MGFFRFYSLRHVHLLSISRLDVLVSDLGIRVQADAAGKCTAYHMHFHCAYYFAVVWAPCLLATMTTFPIHFTSSHLPIPPAFALAITIIIPRETAHSRLTSGMRLASCVESCSAYSDRFLRQLLPYLFLGGPLYPRVSHSLEPGNLGR